RESRGVDAWTKRQRPRGRGKVGAWHSSAGGGGVLHGRRAVRAADARDDDDYEASILIDAVVSGAELHRAGNESHLACKDQLGVGVIANAAGQNELPVGEHGGLIGKIIGAAADIADDLAVGAEGLVKRAVAVVTGDREILVIEVRRRRGARSDGAGCGKSGHE